MNESRRSYQKLIKDGVILWIFWKKKSYWTYLLGSRLNVYFQLKIAIVFSDISLALLTDKRNVSFANSWEFELKLWDKWFIYFTKKE